MNALHAAVLSSQCNRYAEVIDTFREEVESDEKLTDRERCYITTVLEHVCGTLKRLGDEIHNNHRHQ